MKNRIPWNALILLGAALVFLLAHSPSRIPGPWFDEGWTLEVARNWVQNGKYARLLNNESICATGMAWNFPVTGPIAFCFSLFGFGFWQGRLPGTLFTVFSISLIYLLAVKMYNEKIAFTSILILILGFPFPLTFGRQAIGEPAMIFYLLAGYYCWWAYLEKRSIVGICASMILWGAALTSKHQALPFWTISMLAVILIAILQRDTFVFQATGIASIGTVIAWRGMLMFQHGLETGLPLYGAPMKGLLQVTGWVPIPEIRMEAMILIAEFALPLLLGLGYTLFLEHSAWKKLGRGNTGKVFYLWLAYWSFTASWLFWFATLAMAWDRYLYPASFLGSVFVATLLFKLSQGLNLSQIVNSASSMLRTFKIKPEGLAALVYIMLVSYVGSVVIRNFVYTESNGDAQVVAEYLMQSTPADAYIETYDSELLFLVQRRFHYPPDQVQVELNKRRDLHQPVEIQYDPMLADPDYIVVGPFSQSWGLYDSTVTQEDTWNLIYELPSYKVYEHAP